MQTMNSVGEQKYPEFESLSSSFMDQMYGAALKMTKNPPDAEDLLQDTYLKALRFYHTFQTGTNVHRWMYRILVNNFITQYKRKRRQPRRIDFEHACKTHAETLHADPQESCVFRKVERYEELFDDKISRAMDRLPGHYREVVLLADVAGLKYEEIASTISVPLGTVMSRLNRGRGLLARHLRRYAHENGFIKTERMSPN